MADGELRALERRWRATGAEADGLALGAALRRVTPSDDDLLARRVQLGLTTTRRLELGAFLGDPRAAAHLGSERLRLTTEEVAAMFGLSAAGIRAWLPHGCPVQRRGRRMSFDAWEVLLWRDQNDAWRLPGALIVASTLVRGCAHWEREAGLRAALAIVRGGDLGLDARRRLHAIEAWIMAPSPETRARLGEVAREAPASCRTTPLVMATLGQAAGDGGGDSAGASADGIASWRGGPIDAGLAQLRLAVARELVPWALLGHEPLGAAEPPRQKVGDAAQKLRRQRDGPYPQLCGRRRRSRHERRCRVRVGCRRET